MRSWSPAIVLTCACVLLACQSTRVRPQGPGVPRELAIGADAAGPQHGRPTSGSRYKPFGGGPAPGGERHVRTADRDARSRVIDTNAVDPRGYDKNGALAHGPSGHTIDQVLDGDADGDAAEDIEDELDDADDACATPGPTAADSAPAKQASGDRDNGLCPEDATAPQKPPIDSARLTANEIPTPLRGLTPSDLERLVKTHPDQIPSASLGSPNGGGLFNGVRMPDDPAWKLEDSAHAYGTKETVDQLTNALRAVTKKFANTPVVSIGHLSAKSGGHLRPHRSHQSGRDVDVGFYYTNAPQRWYAKVTSSSLDLKRTVYFIARLLEFTDIEMVLIDQSLHASLRQTALDEGYSAEVVEVLFGRGPGRNGPRQSIVRHAPGHATHLHLRFKNPLARQVGMRVGHLLVKQHLAVSPPKYIRHVAKTGDTLAKLAARYGTTMREIRVVNGMRSTQLSAGRAYNIPVRAAGQGPVGAKPQLATTKPNAGSSR